MIRRWLRALRQWWQAPVLERLDALEALWRAAGRVPTSPGLIRWDCGHEALGGATDRLGVSRCLACHERLLTP